MRVLHPLNKVQSHRNEMMFYKTGQVFILMSELKIYHHDHYQAIYMRCQVIKTRYVLYLGCDHHELIIIFTRLLICAAWATR